MIKILFLNANPQAETQLQTSQEMHEIEQRLVASAYDAHFDLCFRLIDRFDELQEALLHYKPDIMHLNSRRNNAGNGILFPDDMGVNTVTSEAVKTLFCKLKDKVRCVVLNSCYSVAQANAIAECVDCILGISEDLADPAYLEFITTFYQNLSNGYSVQSAFDSARDCIDVDNQSLLQLFTHRVDPHFVYLVVPPEDTSKAIMPNPTTIIDTSGGSAVAGNVDTRGGDFIGRDKIIYTRSQREELDDYLARAIANYETRMYRKLRPQTRRDEKEPYKFLYAFEIEDADIFFGRDIACEAFYRTLLKDRLTVLHGNSGAGKTSFLQAGIGPKLIREGRLPVYTRVHEDLVLTIKHLICPMGLGPWPELLAKLSLQEFLGAVCQRLSHETQELVVILDQFEEFYVFWPKNEHRQPILDMLARCYLDTSLNVRFIIAIRKDYYADLVDLQKSIPTVFHNEFHLGTLTHEEAIGAITEPLNHLTRPIRYEPELLDSLLSDLTRSGMELPHLQIICTQLFERMSKEESTITLDTYQEMGKAAGILGNYLQSFLDRLSEKQQFVAMSVLKELVSSEETKRTLPYETLVVRIREEHNELSRVLAQLVNARLLHRSEIADVVLFEMAHEYLIREISKWIKPADLAFKRAQELLTREVANWRVHGTLIPKDRLEILYEYREYLRDATEDEWRCILYSALKVDYNVLNWAQLADKIGIEVITSALSVLDSKIRQVAAETLGQLPSVQALMPLTTNLTDPEPEVRKAAAIALGNLGDSRAIEPLIAALSDQDSSIRRSVVSALVQMKDSSVVVESLFKMLADNDNIVRHISAKAIIELGSYRNIELWLLKWWYLPQGITVSTVVLIMILWFPAIIIIVFMIVFAHFLTG